MSNQPMLLLLGLAVVSAACGKDRSAQAAADSVRAADSLQLARASDSAARAARTPAVARERIVPVTEADPGLLAQAKLLPIDAQHLAQTKFPDGAVQRATLERRGGDLVYIYEIQPKNTAGTELVLVNAMDGSIVNTIRAPKKP